MAWHLHKDNGNKDFQSSLPTSVQILTILQSYTFSLGKFLAVCGILCDKHFFSYKVLVCRDSDQNYKPSCDNTIAVAINLQKVAIHVHV